MKCPRCGNEMKEEERCCLRCGELNYSNPLNKNYLKKYGDKKKLFKENSFIFKRRNNKRKFILIVVILSFIVIISYVIYMIIKK